VAGSIVGLFEVARRPPKARGRKPGAGVAQMNLSLIGFLEGVVIAAFATLTVWQGEARAQADDPALEQRIAKEKLDRRDCKTKICDAALNKKADGEDIACNVVKTWTVAELKERILKNRIEWPLGSAQCTAQVKLVRKTLAKVLAGSETEAALEKHSIVCTLDQKDGKDKYTISFSIQPQVKFKDGKAIKASINWSDIQGSAVAKGAVWSTATLDNYVGLLEGAVVENINDFFGPNCDEVKGDLGK
jgi:ribosomal protein L29